MENLCIKLALAVICLLTHFGLAGLSYKFFNASEKYPTVFNWAIGIKPRPSTFDSNYRRFLSRTCLMFVYIFLFLSASYTALGIEVGGSRIRKVTIIAFPLASAWFFFSVVLLMPFKQTDGDNKGAGFDVDIPRLLFDTFVSSLFMICTFAIIYSAYGICSDENGCVNGDRLNSIYFSAVTFSTLGFGDFSPSPSARIFAST